MAVTPADVHAWVGQRPFLLRAGIRLGVMAAIVGLYALAGVITGDGPIGGLEIGVFTAVCWGMVWAFSAYRARTAPRRTVQAQRTRAAYEAAHRGDSGQETT